MTAVKQSFFSGLRVQDLVKSTDGVAVIIAVHSIIKTIFTIQYFTPLAGDYAELRFHFQSPISRNLTFLNFNINYDVHLSLK